MLQEVVSVVLVHQSIDTHQHHTPGTDDDHRGASDHLGTAMHLVVAQKAMMFVNPLDQVIEGLKDKGDKEGLVIRIDRKWLS